MHYDLKDKNNKFLIKDKYLNAYPEILANVNDITNRIIDLSPQCQREIEKYIKAKQKLAEFKYTDKEKFENAKQKIKEDAEKEVIKLIGNQILDIERVWINERNPSMTFIRANNDTRDLLDNILTILEFQASPLPA